MEPDTVFGPTWQALTSKKRELGAMEKADCNEEDGYMVWHTMIAPRKNVTAAQQKRKMQSGKKKKRKPKF